MPEHKHLLTIQNLSARYLGDILLNGVSFSIKEGEQWALVGEKDATKTNLLNTIAGKTVVTSGSMEHHYFEDYLRQNTPDDPYFTYQNLIALVSEKHNFRNLCNMQDFYYQQRYNSFDAEDAPKVESYLSSVKAVANRQTGWTYEKVVSTFKLEPLLQKELIKLSNGETKRLLLAAAVLKNPVLLLLNSPSQAWM